VTRFRWGVPSKNLTIYILFFTIFSIFFRFILTYFGSIIAINSVCHLPIIGYGVPSLSTETPNLAIASSRVMFSSSIKPSIMLKGSVNLSEKI
jgi:formate hydrogenlyase subunit 4